MLDLSQLLCNIHGSALCLLVGVFIVQINTIMDMIYLKNFAKFKSHIEGQWYHDLEYDYVCPKYQETIDKRTQ